MTDFRVEKVHYIPAALEPGILYMSEEFKIAMHLCACGCGSKVPISLGPAGWTVREQNGKPTIKPSIGSGQLLCNSHYSISEGKVKWALAMSAAEAVAALKSDHNRREAYYVEHRWHIRVRRMLFDWFGMQ